MKPSASADQQPRTQGGSSVVAGRCAPGAGPDAWAPGLGEGGVHASPPWRLARPGLQQVDQQQQREGATSITTAMAVAPA
jgi:hypothetical protein